MINAQIINSTRPFTGGGVCGIVVLFGSVPMVIFTTSVGSTSGSYFTIILGMDSTVGVDSTVGTGVGVNVDITHVDELLPLDLLLTVGTDVGSGVTTIIGL